MTYEGSFSLDLPGSDYPKTRDDEACVACDEGAEGISSGWFMRHALRGGTFPLCGVHHRALLVMLRQGETDG